MTKSSTFSVTIRGTMVNGAKVGTFKKSVGSVDETLTLWANAAAAQYVIQGNRNWLDGLFASDLLRLTSGKLSAKGREVAGYIRAFSPVNIAEKDEHGIQTIAVKMNAKNKGVFYSLEKDENGARVKVDATATPEWPLTLREFVNLDKADSAPKSTVKKAATIEKALTGMLEALTTANVSGTYEEIDALAKLADKLAQAAHSAAYAAKPANADVEPVRAGEAAAVTSGKEQRADVNRAAHAESAKGKLTMPITATRAKSKVAANA